MHHSKMLSAGVVPIGRSQSKEHCLQHGVLVRGPSQGNHHEKGSALNSRQVQRAQSHLRIVSAKCELFTPAYSFPLPVLPSQRGQKLP